MSLTIGVVLPFPPLDPLCSTLFVGLLVAIVGITLLAGLSVGTQLLVR